MMDLFPLEEAQEYYQDFKWAFITPAPDEGFIILESDIRKWILSRSPNL